MKSWDIYVNGTFYGALTAHSQKRAVSDALTKYDLGTYRNGVPYKVTAKPR